MSFAILDGKALTSSITDEGLVTWGVWMAILADKDQDGITSLNPRFLAKVFGHDVAEIEEAFKTLSSPDPHSKNEEHEGRRIIPVDGGRWLVVSHEKYRQIYRKEVRRDYLTQAKRAQREREKREKLFTKDEQPPELNKTEKTEQEILQEAFIAPDKKCKHEGCQVRPLDGDYCYDHFMTGF